MKIYRRWCIAILLSFGLTSALSAHNLNQSSSLIQAQGQHISWQITAHTRDIARFTHNTTLERRVAVANNGQACPLTHTRSVPADEPDHTMLDLEFACPTRLATVSLHYNIFFGDRSHVNMAVARLGGKEERWTFTSMDTSHTVMVNAPATARRHWTWLVVGGVALLILGIMGWRRSIKSSRASRPRLKY